LNGFLVKEQNRTQGEEEEDGHSNLFDEATMKTDESKQGTKMEKGIMSEYVYCCSLHLKKDLRRPFW